MDSLKRIYYFLSTHWDREWYLPFQRFRIMLLEDAERILNNLEREPDYRFVFDGQTIVLEDIEEIMPKWRGRLKKQISSGRMLVGPWYVMPDEFLVSGEALIRNLLAGSRLSKEHGAAPWKVGYVCDIFGHIAQLPQILDGFGIGTAVAARGISLEKNRFARWKSPDGTICDLICIDSYGAASLKLMPGAKLQKEESEPEVRQRFIKDFAKYIEPQIERFHDGCVIISDANDHNQPLPNIPQILQWIREAYPESEVIHTDYLNLPELTPERELPVMSGELIHTGTKQDMRLAANSISSRYDIKYENDLTQSQLELETEPMLASLFLQGRTGPKDMNLLKAAWKLLLKNQAHDSICGCSPDETHFCMMPRYHEARQIADGLMASFFPYPYGITAENYYRLDDGKISEGHLYLFNGMPYSRSGVQRAVLHLDSRFESSFTQAGSPEAFRQFRLFDAGGKEIEYTIDKVEKNMQHVSCYTSDFYHIRFPAELKPFGWTAFTLRAESEPVRFTGSLRTGKCSGENEFLRLKIHSDGTFDVVDKRNGMLLCGFNEYLLDSDCGNGWYYSSPKMNSVLSASSGAAEVRLTADCGFLLEYEIVRRIPFNAELEFRASPNALYNGIYQSENEKILEIRTAITLEKGSPALKIRSTVNNTLKDCRLRLSVPTGVSGNYFAGQAFTMLKRKPGLIFENETLTHAEREVEEKNFNGIAGKCDASQGVAFIAAYGLHEVACPSLDESCLYVTLFRAFRRTVCHNGEPDGEIQKKLNYQYEYRFLSGGESPAALFQAQQELRQAPQVYCAGEKNLEVKEPGSVQTKGDAVISALKPSEDGKGIILRLFNPSDKPVEELVKFPENGKIVFCTLEEAEIKSFHSEKITIPPQKIVSLKWSL